MRALAWTLLIAACADAPLADGVQPQPTWFPIPQSTGFDPWNPPRFPAWVPPPVEIPATIAYSPETEPITATASGPTIRAMPSGPSALMALTDDGGTAITADFSHTARIWPTLDGKHEPVVLRMRPPSALALARDGDRLVVGALDGAGQLELVIAKSTGEAERRLAIEAARPFIAIHAVGAGFVALDDERAIYAIASDGKVSAPLVADPEQHVASLVVRGAHVLAMIESDGTVHGRWIEPGHPPKWGEPTPVLPVASERLALSPDGTRIASALRGGKRIGIVELATGKLVARSPLMVENADPQLRAVGFANDKWLVVANGNGEMHWWNGDSTLDENFFGDQTAHVADGVVVGAQGQGLVIAKPNQYSEFLGYRLGGPQMLHSFGNHFLATDTIGVVELDASFRTRKVYTLQAPEQPVMSWSNIMVLDDKHVLASTYVGNHYVVYVISLDGKEAKLAIQDGYPSEFRPSTGILAYRAASTFAMARFDRETGTFGKPVSIPFDTDNNALIKLLDPKYADGNIAGIVETQASSARVTLLKDIHPDSKTPLEIDSMRTVELDSSWWSRVGDLNKLVDPGTPKLPGPGGKRVELRDQRVILTDAKGATLWTVPAHGATAVMWTETGRLVAFGAGIAELDVATGALGVRQCGWRFGKWITDLEGFGSAQLCEAP